MTRVAAVDCGTNSIRLLIHDTDTGEVSRRNTIVRLGQGVDETGQFAPEAIERTRAFRGLYHVLGGSINPIAGIGPEQLHVRELLTRLQDEAVQEVILATDPNLEGEATATYLGRLLGATGIRVTRLASGLPVGGDLEYADEVTLGRAFEGRRLISG